VLATHASPLLSRDARVAYFAASFARNSRTTVARPARKLPHLIDRALELLVAHRLDRILERRRPNLRVLTIDFGFQPSPRRGRFCECRAGTGRSC
jgi:hypothetical protein